MAVSKKKRTHKVSKGVGGAKRTKLDAVTKVLLGKGQYKSFTRIGDYK